eukprot:scaffold37493_cov41-Phaeocystis_antarctica.AAC.1
MWETRWLRYGSDLGQLAQTPEASLSARACPRLPRATASLCQPAAWAALAGPPASFTTQVRRYLLLTYCLPLTLGALHLARPPPLARLLRQRQVSSK